MNLRSENWFNLLGSIITIVIRVIYAIITLQFGAAKGVLIVEMIVRTLEVPSLELRFQSGGNLVVLLA